MLRDQWCPLCVVSSVWFTGPWPWSSGCRSPGSTVALLTLSALPLGWPSQAGPARMLWSVLLPSGCSSSRSRFCLDTAMCFYLHVMLAGGVTEDTEGRDAGRSLSGGLSGSHQVIPRELPSRVVPASKARASRPLWRLARPRLGPADQQLRVVPVGLSSPILPLGVSPAPLRPPGWAPALHLQGSAPHARR